MGNNFRFRAISPGCAFRPPSGMDRRNLPILRAAERREEWAFR